MTSLGNIQLGLNSSRVGEGVEIIGFGSTSLPAYISRSRTGPATAFDSSGALVNFGNNVLRPDYNPITRLWRGWLIEGARTNLLLNSATLSTQDITVTAVAHTLSFYGTGSITLSGAATGTLNGTGAFPNRATLTFTPSAGTLTLTVSGSVLNAQCEIGTFASSWIPTTGASATRAVDSANITNLSSIGFNPLGGTLVVEFEPNTVQTAFFRIATFSDGTANNTIELAANATNWRFIMVNGGVNQFTLNGPTMTTGVRKFAIAYQAGDFGFSVDGGAAITSASGTVPTVDRLALGFTGPASYQGWYRRVTYIPTRLSNAELQARTV